MSETFIRTWKNHVSVNDCNETIAAIEHAIAFVPTLVTNNSGQFFNSSLGRRDHSIFLEDPLHNKSELGSKYLYYLHHCLEEYVQEFGQLKDLPMSNQCNIKVQRTMPMGGYHNWHYENSDPGNHSRELVWMIYLNDMPAGEGETEFLFQSLRIQPTRGTVVIWPAGMTHVHRGLTVHSQPKYIATGWYYKTN